MTDNIESLGISGILPSDLSEQPPSIHSSDPENSDSEYDQSSDIETGHSGNGVRDSNLSRQPQIIHAQRTGIPTVEPTVIPTTYASFRLTSRQNRDNENSFTFDFQPGEKPMPPKVRARSVKALKKFSAPKKQEEKSAGLFAKCCSCNKNKAKTEEEAVADTTLTPELQKASSEGINMMTTIAFPSVPALLQDIWVYLELFISILAFALGIHGTFPVESNEVFQYSYFVLTVINMGLALIDGYIYFVEVGSCARGIRNLKKKLKKNKDDDDDDDDDAQFQKKTCCKPETKEKIHTFFEVGRNVLTELLLYPLLIFDLFSFQTEQTYQPDDILDRIDYGLFIIGSFYLVLAVYIMRLLVLFGSVLSLLRLPKANDSKSSGSLMIKFCLHACGQIIVHLMIILVVGAKINNENQTVVNNTNMTTSMTDDGDPINGDPIIRASPFLWVSIVLGWLLPLAGTAAFFIVNYYWMREFSIDFWLNMISLLQGASFAETVVGGDGFSETKDKTLEFVGNSDYKKVKKQLETYKSPGWWTKFFYPARVPVVAVCGVLYDVCLIAFIVSLILTYDNNHVQLIVLRGDDLYTAIFFIAILIILIANLHILFLLNSLLLILLLFFVICISFICFIILPIILFIYFPIVGLLGYALLLKQLCNSLFRKNSEDFINHAVRADKENLDDYEMKEYI